MREWEFCSALFCPSDLDLDLIRFIYELDPYPLKMYLQTKMNRLRSGF